MARPSLTRAHRVLLGVVAGGACVISGIGFAGSYNSVRLLAAQKGFGAFAYAFPIGVDAGIVVLLSLDLVLTWLRIPFPLLRQTAWLLTAATIAFNAAASWGDALGMAMHAVIPVLFVVIVEASRHAVGRIAAITADRHMESVRLMRWVLSPVPTFRLWRRMKLWELRSYDETVRLEQNRLVYRAQLRFRYGRGWRRSAPFQALLPLKLAKYGVPLDPSILDRIDGPLLSAAVVEQPAAGPAAAPLSPSVAVPTLAKLAAVRLRDSQEAGVEGEAAPTAAQQTDLNVWKARTGPRPDQEPDEPGVARVPGQMSPWFKAPRPEKRVPEPARPAPRPARAAEPQTQPQPRMQAAEAPLIAAQQAAAARQALRVVNEERAARVERPEPRAAAEPVVAEPLPFEETEAEPAVEPEVQDGPAQPEPAPLDVDTCFKALVAFIETYNHQPSAKHLADYLHREFGVIGNRPDGTVSVTELDKLWPELERRYVDLGRE